MAWRSGHTVRKLRGEGRRTLDGQPPHQSCSLSDCGAQTLYPQSPSFPQASCTLGGSLESTVCKTWVHFTAGEFQQLPLTNVFVRSNIQIQVGIRPKGDSTLGGSVVRRRGLTLEVELVPGVGLPPFSLLALQPVRFLAAFSSFEHFLSLNSFRMLLHVPWCNF